MCLVLHGEKKKKKKSDSTPCLKICAKHPAEMPHNSVQLYKGSG